MVKKLKEEKSRKFKSIASPGFKLALSEIPVSQLK